MHYLPTQHFNDNRLVVEISHGESIYTVEIANTTS